MLWKTKIIKASYQVKKFPRLELFGGLYDFIHEFTLIRNQQISIFYLSWLILLNYAIEMDQEQEGDIINKTLLELFGQDTRRKKRMESDMLAW